MAPTSTPNAPKSSKKKTAAPSPLLSAQVQKNSIKMLEKNAEINAKTLEVAGSTIMAEIRKGLNDMTDKNIAAMKDILDLPIMAENVDSSEDSFCSPVQSASEDEVKVAPVAKVLPLPPPVETTDSISSEGQEPIDAQCKMTRNPDPFKSSSKKSPPKKTTTLKKASNAAKLARIKAEWESHKNKKI